MRSSISSWLDHWFNKYAVMALCAAVGLGGYEWICWSGLTASDWGTWVAAVGTVGTLIGTIWLATARYRAELLSARLHAAGMTFHLINAIDELAVVIRDLEEIIILSGWPADSSTLRAKLANIELWSISALIPLSALPNGASAKLASAADQVKQARRLLEKAKDDTDLINSNKGTDFAEGLQRLLVRAAKSISDGIKECNAARTALGLE